MGNNTTIISQSQDDSHEAIYWGKFEPHVPTLHLHFSKSVLSKVNAIESSIENQLSNDAIFPVSRVKETLTRIISTFKKLNNISKINIELCKFNVPIQMLEKKIYLKSAEIEATSTFDKQVPWKLKSFYIRKISQLIFSSAGDEEVEDISLELNIPPFCVSFKLDGTQLIYHGYPIEFKAPAPVVNDIISALFRDYYGIVNGLEVSDTQKELKCWFSSLNKYKICLRVNFCRFHMLGLKFSGFEIAGDLLNLYIKDKFTIEVNLKEKTVVIRHGKVLSLKILKELFTMVKPSVNLEALLHKSLVGTKRNIITQFELRGSLNDSNQLVNDTLEELKIYARCMVFKYLGELHYFPLIVDIHSNPCYYEFCEIIKPDDSELLWKYNSRDEFASCKVPFVYTLELLFALMKVPTKALTKLEAYFDAKTEFIFFEENLNCTITGKHKTKTFFLRVNTLMRRAVLLYELDKVRPPLQVAAFMYYDEEIELANSLYRYKRRFDVIIETHD